MSNSFLFSFIFKKKSISLETVVIEYCIYSLITKDKACSESNYNKMSPDKKETSN